MAGPIDVSGIIPPDVATQIVSIAETKSAALQLGRRVPMPTGTSEMPVQTGVPVAGWVGVGGRKPFTDLTVGMETMKAEEVAAVIAIPQAYLDDSSINLWNFAKPQLASAVAVSLDSAVLFGVAAPPSFPVGGVVADAYCQAAAPGVDAVDNVNKAMGLVEGQGLPVTGSAADISDKQLLRGVRDAQGAFLLGPNQATGDALGNVYGVPVAWEQFPAGVPDFITGDWDALIIGVRQDLKYDISDQAVIADATGKVILSAFQDDCVVMRVYARFGALIVNPPTQKVPAGAKPFASSQLGTVVTPP